MEKSNASRRLRAHDARPYLKNSRRHFGHGLHNYQLTSMARGIALGMCVGMTYEQIAEAMEQRVPVVTRTGHQLLMAVGVGAMGPNGRYLFAIRANAALHEDSAESSRPQAARGGAV